MSYTKQFAEREIDILKSQTPDAVILPFGDQILALVGAFGDSGQSGGSAPYVARAVADAVQKLFLHKPISPVTGRKDEWVNVRPEILNVPLFQNSRCGALFKDGLGATPYYLDAIVWQGEEKHDAFTGSVYVDDVNFELIHSRQFVRFPFEPKSFYVDVVYRPVSRNEIEARGLHYTENLNGSCYLTFVKDTKQLDAVFEYYVRAKEGEK